MSIQRTRLENLRQLIDEYGSQRKLSEAIGYEPSFISQMNTRYRPIGEKIARKIEVSTRKPSGWMDQPQLEAREEEATYVSGNVQPPTRRSRLVPLISWVAAGDLCGAETPYPTGEAEDWLQCPFEASDESYCLRIKGSSMEDLYLDGYIILVDPTLRAEHGDDVIVHTPDGHTMLKRLQITPEGMHLIALNRDWPDRVIKAPEGTRICGVVRGFWVQRR